MITFCTTCDNPLQSGAQFCSKCGAPTGEAPTPSADHPTVAEEPVVLPIVGAPEFPAVMANPVEEEVVADKPPPAAPVSFDDEEASLPPPRNWLLIGGAIGTLLIVGLLYFFLFVADDMSDGSDSGEPVAVTDDSTVQDQQYYTMTEANIRDKATTTGSAILGKLPRGSAVSGTLVPGVDDPTGQWLELTDGKGFVSVVNLMDVMPPELTKTLGDKVWTTDGAVEIWKQPDSTSELLDRVSEGTKLTLSGLTANDYIEIKMKAGGVGYIAGGAAILARLGGKPVDLAFSPSTCSFGQELEVMFQRLGAKSRAEWDAIEAADYPNEEAREAALGKIEGKSRYEKLQRSWNGLSITGIGQHYESQSLYFADPPAKVIEAFRQKGFKIDGEGNFPATELYASIVATRGEPATYGKTDLGCGV